MKLIDWSFSFHPLLSSYLLSLHCSFSSLYPFHLKTCWLLVHFFELSLLFSLFYLSLAYLALEPSSYSHPGSQSLSKGIFLCLPVLLCSATPSCTVAPEWVRGFRPQCGSDSCTWTWIWSPSLLSCRSQQRWRVLPNIGLLCATVDSL